MTAPVNDSLSQNEGGASKSSPFQSDPTARSRRRNMEPGDAEQDLDRVGSPTEMDYSHEKSFQDRIPSDRTSNTEVEREASSAAFRKDTNSDEKTHRGLKDRILHKSKSNDDDNNGKEKKKQHFSLWGQFRAVVFGSWINVLLIFCKLLNFPDFNRH